jgi:hypothetical protein
VTALQPQPFPRQQPAATTAHDAHHEALLALTAARMPIVYDGVTPVDADVVVTGQRGIWHPVPGVTLDLVGDATVPEWVVQ